MPNGHPALLKLRENLRRDAAEQRQADRIARAAASQQQLKKPKS